MKVTETTNTPKALGTLPAGRRGIVHSLEGGREFCSRAVNLGFTAGAPVTVVQNFGHGPMLVSVRETLVALGRGEAGKIWVQAMDGKAAEEQIAEESK